VWLGWLAAVVCALTVFATSMIYASLRSVPRWHTPWTPALYLVFALSGGAMLLAFVAAATGIAATGFIAVAVLAVLLFWAVQLAWWRRGDRMVMASTPETATGLGHLGVVRLLDPPHYGDNYLTREMGFRVARKHARKLRKVAAVLGLALPLLAAALAWAVASPGPAAVLLALAAGAHLAGTLVARWLFFAEARHTVMTYYGGM
jgi:DMSO reductase anchor subunit